MQRLFDEYIEKYGNDLTRLCVSLCCNASDAEDLFQDTWYKAMKNYSKYKEEMPFDKWLFSICVNTYKNYLKLSYNRKKSCFSSQEEKTDFLNSIRDVRNENADDYCELHTALNTLPKKQKAVVILYYFKSYSVKEIAQMLKIPEGTVKSRLSTAKKAIKRRLSNEKA